MKIDMEELPDPEVVLKLSDYVALKGKALAPTRVRVSFECPRHGRFSEVLEGTNTDGVLVCSETVHCHVCSALGL